MTNDEYLAALSVLTSTGRMISFIDWTEFIRKIDEAETLGPILDPTLYMEAAGRIGKIRNMAVAANQLKGACAELVKTLVEEGVPEPPKTP